MSSQQAKREVFPSGHNIREQTGYCSSKSVSGGMSNTRSGFKYKLSNDADFIKLSTSKTRISLILTAFELLIYFGFIGLIAFNKELVGTKIGGGFTLGIPRAVGTIVLSFVFTWIYVLWANNNYDILVSDIKRKIGE